MSNVEAGPAAIPPPRLAAMARILLFALLSLYLSSPQAAVPVPVLVVHSYSQEYPWTKGQHQGFIETLNADPLRTYNVDTEYLDTKRIDYTSAYAGLTAEFFKEKYKDYHPAAIYVSDDNALLFALYHLNRLFPGVPVFFSGINNLAVKSQLDPALVTGVFETKDIAANLNLMRAFDASVRNIIILGDASETYQAIAKDIRSEMTRYPEIRATYISENRIDDLVRQLSGRTERFVFLTTLGAVKDEEGRNLALAETLNAIVNAGKFVVISMEDAYMYPGILGGYVTSGPAQGRAAARLLKQYLDGTSISSLPPQPSPNEYVVNEMELHDVKLVLPATIDRQVKLINTVPSFYEANRSIILNTLFALAGLLLISLSGAMLFIRKNRQIARVKENLVRAQAIAQIGNWEWLLSEDTLLWSEQVYCLFEINPAKRITYKVFLEHVHPHDRDTVKEAVARTLEQGAPCDLDYRIVRPRGEVRFVHQAAELIRDAGGKPLRMIGTFQDITEPKLAEQLLRKKDAHLKLLAYHDVLTGLPNKTLLVERIAHAATLADRSGNMLALLFIDLDRFKTINDSLGHTTGDALLQAAARRLKAIVRATDTVSRFSGDEFMLLLEDVKDRQQVGAVAQKILEAFTTKFDVEGHYLHVSASIGISLYPSDGQESVTLIRNADAAMYKAKDSGRNNFQFYESDITDRVMYRVRMESKLRSAFEEGKLEVFYQPLVELQSGRICGAEALLRWNDPEDGDIAPAEFIPLAEETGLIIAVGEWVIRKACRALKTWSGQTDLDPDFAVNVNFSGKQLAQKNLLERLDAIFRETGVEPDRIVLELTESTITASEGDSHEVISALRGIGVHIAIDDFGTGYSSLSRLKELPIRELKIDRSFIRDIAADSNDRAIVKTILALAASLELRVVAEGVEELEQEEVLRKEGCQYAQGFYYGRPMPEHDLIEHITAGRPRSAEKGVSWG